MPEWWAEEFGPDYAALLEAITDPERTEAEARACVEILGLKEEDRVLDMGCGFGRHTKIFARNRLFAVGVDYSRAMLERALELSGTELAPYYVRASMHHFHSKRLSMRLSLFIPALDTSRIRPKTEGRCTRRSRS
ncbi:MAG: hypothetical protein C4317_08085 [Acidimicrobiia bacterium]